MRAFEASCCSWEGLGGKRLSGGVRREIMGCWAQEGKTRSFRRAVELGRWRLLLHLRCHSLLDLDRLCQGIPCGAIHTSHTTEPPPRPCPLTLLLPQPSTLASIPLAPEAFDPAPRTQVVDFPPPAHERRPPLSLPLSLSRQSPFLPLSVGQRDERGSLEESWGA